jgi:hypothetical protein
MATEVVTSRPAQLPTWTEPPKRVSWGSIFGGAVVALAVWALLYSLGLALGLSSINPQESIRGEALFTGIWSVISPLIALFIGGYVAARLAGLFDRTASALHGVVLWGLTFLLGMFAVMSVLSAVAGTAVSVGSAAVSGVAGSAEQVQQATGVSANQLLGPINERLRAQGKPEITAQQLQAALQSAAGTALQEGRLDRGVFESALAQNTNLTQQDVRELTGQAQGQLGQAGTQLEQTAASAASAVGKAFWGIFFALLLGLVSSVLGAIAGAAGHRRYDRRLAARRVPTERTAVPHRTEVPHAP